MTWGNTIIAVMTVANFGLLLLLTNHVIKSNRIQARAGGAAAPLDDQGSQLVEPEKQESEAIFAPAFQAAASEAVPPRAGQTQAALLRLRSGESQECVARDLGYSRSEIGILAASSRKSSVELRDAEKSVFADR